MRSHEVVIAAQQLEVCFQSLPPSRITERPASKVRRALADRQIQPFDERRVQLRRVLAVTLRLFPSPGRTDPDSSLHSSHAIIPPRPDHLAVETGRPKHAPYDFFVELESVRGYQRKTHEIHAVRNISKEGERVSVAPSPDDRRRPEPRIDVDRDEYPDRLLLATDDRANLVGLQLLDGQARNASIIESMTGVGGPFKPAIDRMPGDSLDSCDGGLVQAFDAEGGDLVEGRAAMLLSMVRRPGVGAESLAASPASVSTTLSPFRPVEAVADDPSSGCFSRQWAFPVCAAETLRCAWTGRR